MKKISKVLLHLQGFTLIEFLIYMGILSVLTGVITSIFFSILDAGLAAQSNSTIQQDGRFLLARLSYDIHNAQSVVSPALGATNSALQLVISGVTYTYQSDTNGNIVLTNNLGANNLNGYDSSISALTFQASGNTGGKSIIQINFLLNSRTFHDSGTESATFQEVISTR